MDIKNMQKVPVKRVECAILYGSHVFQEFRSENIFKKMMKWWNSFETPSREVPTQAAQFAPLKGFAANLVPLTDPMHCSASANTSLQDLKRFRDLSWATQNWSNHKWMDEQCWTICIQCWTMLNKSSCRGTQCLTLFLEKCWEVARPFRIQMKADSSARSLFFCELWFKKTSKIMASAKLSAKMTI